MTWRAGVGEEGGAEGWLSLEGVSWERKIALVLVYLFSCLTSLRVGVCLRRVSLCILFA